MIRSKNYIFNFLMLDITYLSRNHFILSLACSKSPIQAHSPYQNCVFISNYSRIGLSSFNLDHFDMIFFKVWYWFRHILPSFVSMTQSSALTASPWVNDSSWIISRQTMIWSTWYISDLVKNSVIFVKIYYSWCVNLTQFSKSKSSACSYSNQC